MRIVLHQILVQLLFIVLLHILTAYCIGFLRLMNDSSASDKYIYIFVLIINLYFCINNL